jgi:hypothetical protein
MPLYEFVLCVDGRSNETLTATANNVSIALSLAADVVAGCARIRTAWTPGVLPLCFPRLQRHQAI